MLQSHDRFKRPQLYLHGERVGHDAVHRVFCEGVEVFVRSSHELRLQSVSAPTVVLEHEEIQLHGQIWNNKEKLILRVAALLLVMRAGTLFYLISKACIKISLLKEQKANHTKEIYKT